jgi:phosphopantetheinyl transferase
MHVEQSASVSICYGGAARPPRPEPLWELLSPYELSGLSAVPARKRRDWLSGRIALKHAYLSLTGQLAAMPPSQVEVRNGPSGSPHIPSAPDLLCSITHSHGWGAGAASTEPVGVDIEPLGRHGTRTCELVATGEEVERLREAGVRPTAIGGTLWAIKEAVLKAVGLGLRVPAARAKLVRPQRDSWEVVLAHPGCVTSRWSVWTATVAGFALALARPAHSNREIHWRMAISSDWGEPGWRAGAWRVSW